MVLPYIGENVYTHGGFMLMYGKIDFKIKTVTRDKEGINPRKRYNN